MKAVLCLAVLLGTAACASAQELSAANLTKIKDATVYVRAARGGKLSMGSGFLFKKNATTGWILTCEHVIRGAAEIEVVFKSGETNERKAQATLMAKSAELDLACLRVRLDALPTALELGGKTTVRETENVYGAGFPFGEALATSNRNPNISVTKVSVSSIRRGNKGEVVTVQLSGDLNPGNSGGPVVDSKGNVVGVTAAKIEGTGLNFAVPPEQIQAFLKPKALRCEVEEESRSEAATRWKVTLELHDPCNTLKSASFAWVRRTESTEREPEGYKKGTLIFPSLMKTFGLKIDGDASVATGTFEVARAAKEAESIDILFQYSTTFPEGGAVWSDVDSMGITFRAGAPAGAKKPEPKPEAAPGKPKEEPVGPVAGKTLATADSLEEAGRLDLQGVVSDVFLSADGAWLYALDLADGRLLKIATATMTVSASADIGEDATCLCLGAKGDKLYVASRVAPGSAYDENGRGRVQAYATADLAPGASVEFKGDPVDVEVTTGGIVVVSIYAQWNGVIITDMAGKTETPVHHIYGGAYIRLHPDQTRFYSGDIGLSPSDHRCTSLVPEGNTRSYPSWDSPYHGDHKLGGEFAISPDGRFLLSSAGSVLRLGKTRESDMQFVKDTDPWICAALATDYVTYFVGTKEGFVKQYRLGSFELDKSFDVPGICAKLALDGKGGRLYGFVIPEGSLKQQSRSARVLGCGSLVAWKAVAK